MTKTVKPRILIVDDEERFRITLCKLLKAEGLDAAHIGGAMEALELIRDQEFDVILLDVKMPGMNGIEALAEIKKIRRDIEVIMLTGHASVDMAVEIMRLGGYEYLLKPCPIDELLLKIDLAHERRLEKIHQE
ncbi:Response regulator receiver protein [uncultured Desulfobacterium sp.]|uniref:Response regulator receiver protein n=1 Tax=uncultured Desulfobacterium sp. TaxID=201089 RepID=A0A445MY77_9BACT|nr:Response regulator receiver protein [uncultured Desulfobacterium sp.]